MTKPGGTDPEFAVTVADPWQGKGIGVILMEQLIAIAKERGITSLWGIVLAENTHMLALARKLGCKISRGADAHEYEIRIDLSSVASD